MGDITGDYVWHMEDVLYQYYLPYDVRHPLICFDERPCFLIDDVGGILPMSPGKAKRYHYEYQKNGSCCVFLAFEPHTGFRYVEVRERRTARDYAHVRITVRETASTIVAKRVDALEDLTKVVATSTAAPAP